MAASRAIGKRLHHVVDRACSKAPSAYFVEGGEKDDVAAPADLPRPPGPTGRACGCRGTAISGTWRCQMGRNASSPSAASGADLEPRPAGAQVVASAPRRSTGSSSAITAFAEVIPGSPSRFRFRGRRACAAPVGASASKSVCRCSRTRPTTSLVSSEGEGVSAMTDA